MSVWSRYTTRIESVGGSKRGAAYKRECREISNKIKDSLSYHGVTIDGEEQNVAIVSSKNTDEKAIMSLPGESIKLGGLVEWMDNHWLITEKDANTTVYEKGLMEQCNHILKWIDADDGEIYEQWCIISDGTKYMTGEFEDRQFIVTRPDSRIVMIIARNEHTVKFGRIDRFLIDDPDSPIKLSYQLTKPVKLGSVFNNEGVFKFVLQEVNSTIDDNHELGIADYYKYFPREGEEEEPEDTPVEPGGEGETEPDAPPVTPPKKGWL